MKEGEVLLLLSTLSLLVLVLSECHSLLPSETFLNALVLLSYVCFASAQQSRDFAGVAAIVKSAAKPSFSVPMREHIVKIQLRRPDVVIYGVYAPVKSVHTAKCKLFHDKLSKLSSS